MRMMPVFGFKHAQSCPARTGWQRCDCCPDARRFKVHTYSFPTVDVIAKTHGQARYAVFSAMCEAGYQNRRDMHHFLIDQSPRAWAVDWDAPYEVEI